MSYCKFQNTFQDLKDCLHNMEDAGSLDELELSNDETKAFNYMYEYCQWYMQEWDRLSNPEPEIDRG